MENADIWLLDIYLHEQNTETRPWRCAFQQRMAETRPTEAELKLFNGCLNSVNMCSGDVGFCSPSVATAGVSLPYGRSQTLVIFYSVFLWFS